MAQISGRNPRSSILLTCPAKFFMGSASNRLLLRLQRQEEVESEKSCKSPCRFKKINKNNRDKDQEEEATARCKRRLLLLRRLAWTLPQWQFYQSWMMFSQSKKKKKEQRWRAASVAWSCGVLAGGDKSDLPAWARQTEVSANQRRDFHLLFQSLCSLSLPDGHVKQIKTFEEHSICLSVLPRLLIISSRELFFFRLLDFHNGPIAVCFGRGRDH